jgi:hypothetical protein
MIQPDVHRIQDLTDSLARCRQQLAETKNANAREIYERVIIRYEKVIADLSHPPGVCGENVKPANSPSSP